MDKQEVSLPLPQYLSEDFRKYIVIQKVQKEFMDRVPVFNPDQVIKTRNDTTKILPKSWNSDSICLILLSPQKLDIQNFYNKLSKEWFESSSNLWNFTLNPDLRLKPGSKDDTSVKRYLFKKIRAILGNKKISFCIEKVVIYWEWGTKNKKFHCNICCKVDPDEDPRYYHYILGMFRKIGQCEYKDQRALSEYDFYNIKDAGFMSRIGHAPAVLENIIKREILALKN